MYTHMQFTRRPFTRQEMGWPGQGDAVATGTATQIRELTLIPLISEAIATGEAGGLAKLISKGLDLTAMTVSSGDIIVIDTDRMTVLHDNVNAVCDLADGSKWFWLGPEDEITIAGTGSATVTVLWKDRWT